MGGVGGGGGDVQFGGHAGVLLVFLSEVHSEAWRRGILGWVGLSLLFCSEES